MKIKPEKSVCEWLGVASHKPAQRSNVGIALDTLGNEPINGLRQKEENGANGWYIWCGDAMLETTVFFTPLSIDHIADYLPQVEQYLDLPAGYRFLIDNNNYEDIWFDEQLLNTQRALDTTQYRAVTSG